VLVLAVSASPEDCGGKTAMNDLFERGMELFNAGRYFDAHEVWEDLWREMHGRDKLLVQALVQSAVALHHASTGNYVGAKSVMERAIRNMAMRRAYRTVSVTGLRRALEHLCSEIKAGRPFASWRLQTIRRSARADEE
jgi:predicted metal-dependent hydrolase